MSEYIMGNGAIAMGALKAGVSFAAGYPGTPSSEIIETLNKRPHEGVYLEWSVNEKAALEAAAAAAMSGARALVTMKQVGLNVASDPLMSLAYVGVKGGLVIVSADDPGPISSQTEQDTRRFADFARIPVFDPSSVSEAYEMIQDAFSYSEKYKTPVLFRPTTRVCHAYASIDIKEYGPAGQCEGFVKDSSKWVIFPRLSYKNHGMIEERNANIGKDFSDYRFNRIEGSGERAVITSGISYAYVKEALKSLPEVKLIKIATAYPFPEDFAIKALDGVREVICIEELSPYIEEQILKTVGKHRLDTEVSGKINGKVPHNGENSVELSKQVLSAFLKAGDEEDTLKDMPAVPARPPVLCAGCPHRASFYAVKQAAKGIKSIFCGDIGCYTLGNAMPLDMVDTCLCMGAGITMAQGFSRTNDDTACFAFVGDSTFFASGLTGVVNAVYNEADMILCILDNSTTAMTGHQPHPGTGINLCNGVTDKVDIVKILKAVGVKKVITTDPLDQKNSIEAVKECLAEKGVKAVIFKSPCIAVERSDKKCVIDREECVNCKRCIHETGCPALITVDGNVTIDATLCTGCGLCKSVCPKGAVGGCERQYREGGRYE